MLTYLEARQNANNCEKNHGSQWSDTQFSIAVSFTYKRHLEYIHKS